MTLGNKLTLWGVSSGKKIIEKLISENKIIDKSAIIRDKKMIVVSYIKSKELSVYNLDTLTQKYTFSVDKNVLDFKTFPDFNRKIFILFYNL